MFTTFIHKTGLAISLAFLPFTSLAQGLSEKIAGSVATQGNAARALGLDEEAIAAAALERAHALSPNSMAVLIARQNLPEFGILIPGLNSGFSIVVPGFSMCVVVEA